MLCAMFVISNFDIEQFILLTTITTHYCDESGATTESLFWVHNTFSSKGSICVMYVLMMRFMTHTGSDTL